MARQRFDDLAANIVPAVAKGERWVPGVDLAQVAALLELPFDPQPALPAPELVRRLQHTLATALRLLRQFPAANLQDRLPNRDRTCLALANHIVEIAAGYLQVVAGRAFDAELSAAVPAVEYAPQALAERALTVQATLASPANPERVVETFFGPTTLHQVLERCAWHAAQHTRQLAMLLLRLGIEPDQPLADADLAGLPVPANVWDA